MTAMHFFKLCAGWTAIGIGVVMGGIALLMFITAMASLIRKEKAT